MLNAMNSLLAKHRPQVSVKLMLLLTLLGSVCFAAFSILPKDDQVIEAVRRGDVDRVQWIATWYPQAIRSNRFTDSLLHDVIAQKNDNVELVEAILKAKPDLQVVRQRLATPLVYAMRAGQTEIAKTLIKTGASVNLVKSGAAVNSISPLHEAIRLPASERDVLVPLLIASGADVGHISQVNQSALSVLCSRTLDDGTTKLLTQLIDAGADINELNSNGDSALTLFVQFWDPSIRSVEFFRELILLGADLGVRNKQSRGPLYLAARKAVVRARSLWNVTRRLPLSDWDDPFVQTLLQSNADDEEQRAQIDSMLHNPGEMGLSAVREILAAVKIPDHPSMPGLSRGYVWISSHDQFSVGVHEGNPFGRSSRNDHLFLFPSEDARRRNRLGRNDPSIPMVRPSEWTDPTIEVDPNGKSVTCRMAGHSITLDTATRKWTRGVE